MSAPATLCLSMIVRTEVANLQRCLDSLADHIGCWMIGDAGAPEGTAELVRAFFHRRGLPGEIFAIPPGGSHQTITDRLRGSRLAYDYLLQIDADCTLLVEDEAFRTQLHAPCYDLVQPSGLRYLDACLLRRDIVRHHGGRPASSEATPVLPGVRLIDHATGATRAAKRKRQLRYLLRCIEQEPHDGHHWFCLARALQDAGLIAEAAKVFAKRAGMAGGAEEAWYARLQEARCRLAQNDEAGFLRAALAAYDQRPQRAEPLYDLARFYRERGMHNVSVLYAEAGLGLDRPDRSALFVEPFVHDLGLAEEYSLAAHRSPDPLRQERGHAAADWLTLSRATTTASRQRARATVDLYSLPAKALMPSFAAQATGFAAPDGWHTSNPAVARRGDQLVLVQRCVNHTVTAQVPGGAARPVASRNFLLRLHGDLRVAAATEILPPIDLPAEAGDLARGFESARPFVWRGELWCCATYRQLSPDGWCEQVLARIDCPPTGPARLADWCVLRPEGLRQDEMNWMPVVAGDELRFIAGCDPVRVLNDKARLARASIPPIAAEPFSGSSQAIGFDRGWLALVHEVADRNGARSVRHRFVWFDAEFYFRGVSRRFYLQHPGAEFAAGLAWHPNGERLLISFGVDDRESWLATVHPDEVRAILSATEEVDQVTAWRLLPAADPRGPAPLRERVATRWQSAA